MPRVVAVALAMTTGSLALGCTEDPTYAMRWRIAASSEELDDPSSVPQLRFVEQCAAVGLGELRITTRRLDNTTADISDYRCFRSGFADGGVVTGPPLPPGDYRLEVVGLRRSGQPWPCEDDPTTPEVDACVARAEAEVRVVEGSQPVVEFVLLAAPQCDDGIDNDRDGQVDEKDPACLLDPNNDEDAEAGLTVFQLSASFLANEAVEPSDVGVASLRLEVDGDPLAELSTVELDLAQWPFRLPLLAERLSPGELELVVTALDASGEPLTEGLSEVFPVDAVAGGFVLRQFDFDPELFLEPIVDGFSVLRQFSPYPGAVDSAALESCDLPGEADVERVRVRVRDENEQILDAETLALGIDPITDEGDGWLGFDCQAPGSAGVAAILSSAPLSWGRYTLELEGWREGTRCFANPEPLLLSPVGSGGGQLLTVERVIDEDGRPPEGCAPCSGNSEVCNVGGTQTLVCSDAGLCVPP